MTTSGHCAIHTVLQKMASLTRKKEGLSLSLGTTEGSPRRGRTSEVFQTRYISFTEECMFMEARKQFSRCRSTGQEGELIERTYDYVTARGHTRQLPFKSRNTRSVRKCVS